MNNDFGPLALADRFIEFYTRKLPLNGTWLAGKVALP